MRIGTKEARWKCYGKRMKRWRRMWNEEESGWRFRVGSMNGVQKVPELVVHRRMSHDKKVKGLEEKKK